MMQAARCYNCDNDESTFYAKENGYSLVKCAGCGLLYVDDPPSLGELEKAHSQGQHAGEQTIEATGHYKPFASKRYIAILRDLFGEGIQGDIAWLDVGCGHGEFMVALQKFCPGSARIVGSEPNIHKQTSARARGLDVQFVDLDAEDQKYDYISLLNVYSHLPDPPLFIAKLKLLLKPDGELILETGDTADFSADEHYRPFYLPDHLSFASEKIVRDILQRLDFEVLEVRKYPYLRVDAVTFGRELLKFVLPGYDSSLPDILRAKDKYPTTDMYIRARKK